MENTFESKLAERVAQAEAQAIITRAESLDKLLDNPAFIETQRSLSAKNTELSKLNTTIHQLNSIRPFVANDGSKYSINVYPINFFGTGLAEILGIISGSRGAFTEELALQYSAITGITMLELMEANNALGSPMYTTRDGNLMEAIPGNFAKLQQLVSSILIKMGIFEFNASSLTEERRDLWFAKSELTARKKESEFLKNATLNNESSFTMED